MANNSDAYYRALERSWQEQLEHEMSFLSLLTESNDYLPRVKAGLLKHAKNRIKRCKWNIARAINLRNKT